ncbi:glutathione transferase GST 23-like [Euphorbia lathyris]|uniref:glutathione transferase GST 23-like n=1 Tax=Euphorbia lathyris TaxID=212925 RepID=UPI003313D3A5
MEEKVKVFRTWSSPFPLRVIWALKLKEIEYDTVFEDLSDKSSMLQQYNPVYKKVPVLVHDGNPICESLVILEYVDETWIQYPLMPQDPLHRAKVRFWAKFGDDKVLQSIAFGVLVKEGKEQEEAISEAVDNLKQLEGELEGKKFFGGDKIGALDLALGWIAYYVGVFEEVIGLKLIHQQNLPLLTQWIHEFGNLGVIKESWPPFDKLVSKFA